MVSQSFRRKWFFFLYELEILLRRALRLADLAALEALGVEVSRFGSLEYVRKQKEYQRMQEIAETAHFLDFDGLIVPSARWTCQNVVIFSDRVPPEALSITQKHGPVDWAAWERKREEHQHR